mgnify:FL=1
MCASLKRVIIVGAGPSGLQAASTLRTLGNFDIQILEASSRIGGRVLDISEKFAGFPIELGAEFVHGHKSTNYQYAKQAGAKMVNLKGLKCLINCRGTVHDAQAFFELDPELKAAFQEWDELDLKKVSPDKDVTLKEYAKILAGTKAKDYSYDFAFRGLGHEWGADWSKLSVKTMQELKKELEDAIGDDEDPGDFEDYVVVPPISQSEILRRTFGHLSELVRFNTCVRGISYDLKEVVLKDQNGSKYSADAVIITVPLSILKKGTITFNPALPESKVEAIQKLEMGKGGKVFIKFKKNLWGDYYSFMNDGFIVQYCATGQCCEPHLNKVISGFVMGSEAEMFGSISKEKQREILKKDLQAFFGAKGFEENYEDHFYFGWEFEPNILGAILYPGAASLRKALQKSIANKLYFAGEATNFHGYSQTLSGAFDSGKRAAEELTKNFN